MMKTLQALRHWRPSYPKTYMTNSASGQKNERHEQYAADNIPDVHLAKIASQLSFLQLRRQFQWRNMVMIFHKKTTSTDLALVGFESPQGSSKNDPPSSSFEVCLQLPFGAECIATSYSASASHPDQPALF